MGIGALYRKIALLSPYIEVMLRKLYWMNVNRLGKYRPSEFGCKQQKKSKSLEFGEIIKFLKNSGVNNGSLIVVHSSYDVINRSGLKPNEIICELRALIGEKGTLAMPVIRAYKDYPKPEDWLTTDFSKIECTYNPRRTPVTSGLLPSILMRDNDAVISLHPVNPLVAIGPLSHEMMADNLRAERPTPHGEGSSWKFCVEHDAVIVSIGVNLVHHLTIAHVAEDSFDNWPYKDWYNEIPFNIVMPDDTIVRRIIRERKPKWGLFYDAELNMDKALRKAGLIKEIEINGVKVALIRSKKLIDFMYHHKHKGFPYYKI